MANKAIVADHLLTSFFVLLKPPQFLRKQKTAGRAATLTSGPIDSLFAYRYGNYLLTDSLASAIRAGGVK